jgi:hypothetical protein
MTDVRTRRTCRSADQARYAPPTTAEVTVVATKTDQVLGSQVALKLTDAAGNVKTCA